MDIIKVLFIILFPVIRIAGMPVLTYLPFAISNFFLGGRRSLPKEYFVATVLASIYIFFHILFTVNSGSISVAFKDYFFCFIPWIFLALLAGIRHSGSNYWVLKTYFYINLAVAVFSKLPFEIPRRIIQFYYILGMGNMVSDNKYLEYLTSRPGGMLIHPPWFGFMMYLLGRFFFTRENKKYYLALSLAGIVLSGAKGALMSFVVIESFLFLSTHRSFLIKALKGMAAFVLMFFLMVFVCWVSPYFRDAINIVIGDYRAGLDWSFYSISYRVEMYEWAFRDILSFVFGGVISTSHLSDIGHMYIDSEVVMRSMQFGFVGYILLIGNYAAFYLRSLRSSSEEFLTMGKFILLFVFLGSLTTTIATNMVFVLFLVIVIDLCEKGEEGQVELNGADEVPE